MANTIQIKRNGTDGTPTSLSSGELAWANDATATAANSYLYIGDVTASATVTKIGGSGWGLELLNDTTLTGTSKAVTASQGDNDVNIATTAYVDLAVSNASPAMTDISDVTLSSQANADILVYDTGTSTWKNQDIGGHVTMDNTGDFTVVGVQANAINLGADTTGTYVTALTGTANEISVSASAGEAKTYTLGLGDGTTGNVEISGTLTVQGGTTTVESTVVSVVDPIFVVGANASSDSMDRGMEFKYNDGTAKTGFFGWDRDANAFTMVPDRTNTSEVISGSVGNAIFGDITGTLQTAVQTNITAIGTIATGVWNATAISTTKGGTGQDFSSSTGVMSFNSGTASVASNLVVALGGTGLSTIGSNKMLYGNGTGVMQEVAVPTVAGAVLSHSSGVPTWSNAMDGGTF